MGANTATVQTGDPAPQQPDPQPKPAEPSGQAAQTPAKPQQGKPPTSLLDQAPSVTTPTPTPQAGAGTMPEYMKGLEKFWLADKNAPNVEAMAQSYGALQSKLGGFTGPPTNEDGTAAPYDLKVPSDLEGAMQLNADSPLYQGFTEVARKFGMNQACAQELIDFYLNDQFQDQLGFWQNEMAELGTDGKQVTAHISQWGTANLSPEEMAALRQGCSSAAATKMARMLIQKMETPTKIEHTPTRDGGAVDEFTRLRAKITTDKYMTDAIYRAETDAELERYYERHPESDPYGGGSSR